MTTTTITRSDRRQRRIEAARVDFASYCRYVHDFKLPLHYLMWADLLASRDPMEASVAISAPPEFGKSRTLRMWIEFSIGRNPEWARLLAMNAASQAEKQVMAIEQTLRYNPLYRQVFPHIEPDDSRGWNKSLFFVKRRNFERPDPTLQGTGVGGPVQGARVEEIFCDDLVDQNDVKSATIMETQEAFLRGVLYDRLRRDRHSGQPVGKFLAIMTRWGENDLWDVFTNSPYHDETPGMAFKAVQTPAINNEDPYDWGPLLYPEEFTHTRLEQIRLDKGAALYTMTYLCDPSAMGGIVFDRAKFNRFDLAKPPEFTFKIHSWDCASGASDDASFSVMEEWCMSPQGFFLTHVWRERPNFTQLKGMVYRYTSDRMPNVVLIENKGDGVGLIRDIKADGGLSQLREYNPGGASKTERARQHTGLLETGRLWVPARAPWAEDFLRECAAFPKARYDDQVDAMSQALAHMREVVPGGGRPSPGSWMGISRPRERVLL